MVVTAPSARFRLGRAIARNPPGCRAFSLRHNNEDAVWRTAIRTAVPKIAIASASVTTMTSAVGQKRLAFRKRACARQSKRLALRLAPFVRTLRADMHANRQQPWTEASDEALLALHAQDASLAEMISALGRSSEAIDGRLRRLGHSRTGRTRRKTSAT